MMKRYVLAFFLFAACVSCFAQTNAGRNPKVLLLVRDKSTDYDWFIQNEVMPMMKCLRQNGIAFDVWSPANRTIEVSRSEAIKPLRLSDVDLGDYQGIVIPCMGSLYFPVPDDLTKLVNEAHRRKLIIAAQHSPEVFDTVDFRVSTIAIKPGVVKDRNVITSFNCPMTALSDNKPIDTEALITALKDSL